MALTVHHNAMQKIIWLPLSSALVLVLSGCANNGGARNDPLGTGPFDSQGNYHEEWANDPSKWSKPGKRSPQPSGDELPLIAKNDQPPPNASPLAPAGAAYSKTPPRVDSVQEPAHHSRELKIVSVKPKTSHSKSTTKTHVADSSPTRSHTTTTKSHGDDSPAPKSHVTSTKTTKPKTHSTGDSDSSNSGNSPSTKAKSHVTSNSSTKSKSSGTSSKPKSKSGSYTVKSGDSLERIAKHSGTSVSAIKKANGMSGELIHPGQTLVVPK